MNVTTLGITRMQIPPISTAGVFSNNASFNDADSAVRPTPNERQLLRGVIITPKDGNAVGNCLLPI